MATNDGYAPYSLGLTALQVKDAITRASNLSTEFLGYVGYSASATEPVSPKNGDIWSEPSTGVIYRAYVDDTDPNNIVTLHFGL